MNWFFRWFQNRLNRINYEETVMESTLTSSARDIIGSQSSLQFTVHIANGGYVLEYHSYDEKRDHVERRLYVIQENEDLGESLSKTITLELLRK